jgi:alkanesulfonate monooxygenase
MAAEVADVTYAVHSDIADAQAYYSAVKSRATRFGRDADGIVIMPGLFAVVGESDEQAQARYRAILELVDPVAGLAHVSGYLGDLSAYDLDGLVPTLELDRRGVSRGQMWVELARREGLTIRQLCQRMATANGHLEAVGTPEHIADIMEQWFTSGAADGFTLVCPFLPSSLAEFTELVVPELQRRGLFRTAYEGATLRENLGINPPA